MRAGSSVTATPASIWCSTDSGRLSEAAQVVCWRLATLSEAGYPDGSAALLATRSDIDLHRAIDLLRHGCPPDTAVRILG